MGNVVLGNLKWGMTHHLSPLLSHCTSAMCAHMCMVAYVCMCVNCNYLVVLFLHAVLQF